MRGLIVALLASLSFANDIPQFQDSLSMSPEEMEQFLVKTVNENQLNQTVSSWPGPEGLPRGWIPNTDLSRPGHFGDTRYFPANFDPRVVVYYPTFLGRNGARHPIIFFHPGYLFASSAYPGIIHRLVSHGFVIVADDRCNLNALCNPPSMARNVAQTIRWFIQLTRDPRQPQNMTREFLDISRIGVCGHSMGGGTTILVTNEWGTPNHPLRDAEPLFRVRGAVPLQPWNSIFEPTIKRTEVPTLIMGGTLDLLVPPAMYIPIFQQSAPLKVLTEYIAGHTEPALDGGRYLVPTVDFFYATLLGDTDRWNRWF